MQMIMKDVKTMTDKAYIVVNEEQEREVLEKLEHGGFTWWGGDNLTENTPSKLFHTQFPYTIFVRKNTVTFNRLSKLEDEEIVFDGRKEERMSEKYVVSQEFMNELEEWKKRGNTDVYFVGSYDISMLPDDVKRWWNYPEINNFECNNRLIAIIRWVNGEDVFEVEKPKKWVVRSKETDSAYCYAQLLSENNNTLFMAYSFANATRFDTKEEAESWANAHQEVIEVEE